jgi:fibronectin-binding autotransporter adhesin
MTGAQGGDVMFRWPLLQSSKQSLYNSPARSPLALSLEPRMMFDGAIAATVVDSTADITPEATPAEASPVAAETARQEVVFVDSRLQNHQQLVQAAQASGQVTVLIAADQDGLQQIADYLEDRSGIDAIHILGHGQDGVIRLGSSVVDSGSLAQHELNLQRIGSALGSEGDILLYGCEVAAGQNGRELIQQIATLTQGDVAASIDDTGAAAMGGNWTLEYRVGAIESAASLDQEALASYDGLLALPSSTQSFSDTYWNNNTGGNTVDGFSLNESTGATRASSPNSIYFDTAVVKDDPGVAGNYYYELTWTADGVDLGKFDLDGMVIQSFGGNYRLDFSATSEGSPVSQSFTYNGAQGPLTVDLNVALFNDISAFTVRVTNLSGAPSVANMDLQQVILADLKGPNDTPVLGGMNGDSVAWAGVGNTVVLDVGSNATLSDTELGALNGGNGNWAGASLVIQRPGTAVSADTFGFNTSGALFTVSGGNLQSGGQTFATFTNTGGVLTISFTSSAAAATTALVNDIAQRITYRSDTPAGDATLRFTLSDGTASTTADVTVTSDTIYVTNTSDTSTINITNGVSFSEAVAIAAADATGSQTIVFDSSLASTALTINSVSLNESLTFDMDAASGMSLTSGTITLGAATTQTFTNGTGDTATLSGIIAGSGAFTKTGSGALSLSATNTYSGATTVSAGTLTVSGGDAISTNSSVAVAGGATFALSSNETIGNLSGAGAITLGSNTLTTRLTADTTFSGGISGTGGLNVLQTGAATFALTLTGTNTYTGASTLQNFGWLKLDGDASYSNSSELRVNGNSRLTLLSDQTVGSISSSASTASLDLGSFTLSAGGVNTSTTVSGAVSGTGNLVKQGSGTLTLAGTNTYSGTTTVSAGTLSVASDSNLGGNTVTLAAGSTLEITGATNIDNAIALSGDATVSNSADATLSGVISGANTLTKAGASALTLSGTNTYAGTTASAGTLSVASDASLGSGAVNLATGSTLAITGATNIDNGIVLNGNATVSNSANATLSGVISGANTLTKAGASTLTLSGTNTYAGTSVSAGTLSVASDVNLGSGTVTLASGSTLDVTGATIIDNAIALAGNATVSNSANATLSGVISGGFNLAKSGASALTLSGSNTYSGTTMLSAGTLSIAGDSNLGSGAVSLAAGTTLAITGSATIDNNLMLAGAATVQAASAVTWSGVISGGNTLAKTGAGTLTLSASNTATGTTTVSAGTLSVTGSTAGATAVASGATLGGSGTLGGTVTVQNGGTLSPGVSPGTLTVNGDLSMAAGSTLAVEINGTTAGTQYDQVIVNGAVDVSGATLSATHGYSPGSGDSYTIIVNDAADAVTGSFSGLAEGATVAAGGNGTVLTASYIGGTGNDFTLTAPVMPTVSSVSSISANSTYKVGDSVVMVVNFSEAVFLSTGTIELMLETGTTDRAATYLAGSGSSALYFSYTVQEGDISSDLDFTGTTALVANGDTIQGGSFIDANLTLPSPGAAGSIAASKDIVIDGVRPTASIVVADTALAVGETSTVTITFNEAVSGLAVGDFTVANGVLSSLSSGDGGITWTATLTPTASTTDTTNLIVLDNTGVADASGNTGTGTTDSNNYAIDTLRPTASIVVADTALVAGETSTVTITFNEAISGLAIGDFTVANGVLSGLSSGDGGITWTATLTPTASITDTSNLITLDNTGVADAAGNTGTGTTDSNNYFIDTVRPTASIVVTDTVLKAGQTTLVTITFSEAVTGLTTADFSVANGSLSGLSSGDGGITWTATLAPTLNVTDTSNLITLDNTGVQDAVGNIGSGTTDSNNYVIDSKAPVITSVSVPTSGTYTVGNNLDFTVNLDEALTVDTSGGTPRIAINLDTGGTVYASYLSGSGSTALVFRLTVVSGQMDSNGISLGGSIDANGGTLRDAAGNNGTTTLNAVGSTAGVLIDTFAPQVNAISLDGASPTNASSVTFTVTFTEDVSGVDISDFSLVTSDSVNGTLQSLTQIDPQTYRVTVVNITGLGSLGLNLNANGTGIADGAINAISGSFTGQVYTIGIPAVAPTPVVTGDPEFRANPPSQPITLPPTVLQPTISLPPPSTTQSPLIPPPLFEVPTIGSGIPTLGNIFINQNVLAPSFIAQVFASSSSDIGGDGSGSGFLGFGGGDGGVFGSSSLSNMFGQDSLQEPEQLEVFDGKKWGGSEGARTGTLGAPTLGQQLHQLHENEQRQVRELALALGQFANTQAQA